MNMIEHIYELEKAAFAEETPMSEKQRQANEAMEAASHELMEVDPVYAGQVEDFFGMAAEYGRESEKNGFVWGFKVAMNLMAESRFGLEGQLLPSEKFGGERP